MKDSKNGLFGWNYVEKQPIYLKCSKLLRAATVQI